MLSFLAGLPRQAFELSAYTLNALTGNIYLRFLGLRSAAERALAAGQAEEAEHLSQELLRLAEQFTGDWNYGNAVHQGHIVLGLVALGRGDEAQAAERLLLAGQTPGSPQLNSFGPNMSLAKAFLEEGGSREVVIEYLALCGRFWGSGTSAIDELSRARLEGWKRAVLEGEVPDFGANLYY
jgi:hypothetical protein